MTLLDPRVDQAEVTAALAERLEAMARSVMAARCRLKQQPGTHAEQAELVEQIDRVIDRWLEITR